MSYWSELFQHRELLWYWTRREVSVRYKQSLLGVLWAVLQPLALTITFTVVFSMIINVPTGDIPYPIFTYTALVPWTFFANSLGQGIPSLVGQMNLITKASFPREILPFGTIGATFVDFCFASLILVGLFIVYRIPVSIQILWLPFLVIIQIGLSAGVILFGSALNVFFRDIRFIIPLLIQIWMYATPIVYPAALVPDRLKPLYNLNPMVGIIESYRAILLMGLPPVWSTLSLGIIVSTVLLVVGYFFFKRVEPMFVDII